MSDLVPTHRPTTDLATAPGLAAAMSAAVRFHAAGAGREATHRARASDWRVFVAWCAAHELAPLPASAATVAAFVAGQVATGGKAPATVRRYLASIAHAHRAAGHASPCGHDDVRQVMRGILDDLDAARASAVAGRRGGAVAVLTDDVRAMIDATPGHDLVATRDRAIVLVGYAAGLRRSELAAVSVERITWEARGVVIDLGRTKTTTASEGREVSIPYGNAPATCPVRALRAWIDAAGIHAGPVFVGVSRWGKVASAPLSGQAIGQVVKRAAELAGLDVARVSAHSLRAGHVTQRRINGDDASTIGETTGHRSERMVRHYDRGARRFRHDVAGSLGL